jgi:hypothetical protein
LEHETKVLIGNIGSGNIDRQRTACRILVLPVDGRRRRAVAHQIIVIHDDGVAAIGDVCQRIGTGVGIGLHNLDHRAAGNQLDPDETDTEFTGIEGIVRVGVVIDSARNV